VTVEPPTPMVVAIASSLAVNQGGAFQSSRDGWSLTAWRDRWQCKHVRYPAIAEADDHRMASA